MTGHSGKAKLLRELREAIQTLIPFYGTLIGSEIVMDDDESSTPSSAPSSSSSSSSDFLEEVLYGQTGLLPILSILTDMYQTISSSRYVDRGGGYLNRRAVRVMRFDASFQAPPSRFKVMARMNIRSFDTLTNLIRDHPIFFNNSNNAQEPVEFQLLLTLSRLGGYGNGASVMRLGEHYMMSDGTVDLWTWRCITAINSLLPQYITWPDANERLQLQARTARASPFSNCVGNVDGSLFPLFQRPGLNDASDFFAHRKYRYCFNVMCISDIDAKIRYLELGWSGSQHDQRVWDSTVVHQEPWRFFSPGQYLLADHGYLPTRFLVSGFKRPSGGECPYDQRQFNKAIAKTRLRAEHTFGYWKSRFMSTRQLRVGFNTDADHHRVFQWISATAVLHNFLMGIEGEDFWEGEDMEELQRGWEEEARLDREARAAFEAQAGLDDYRGRGDNRTRSYVKNSCEANRYRNAIVE